MGPVTLSRNRARLWSYRERYPKAAGFRGVPGASEALVALVERAAVRVPAA